MRKSEPKRSVVFHADDLEQPCIHIAGRCPSRIEARIRQAVEPEPVFRQVTRGDSRLYLAVHSMLDIPMQLPSIDISDHASSLQRLGTHTFPAESTGVNAPRCPTALGTDHIFDCRRESRKLGSSTDDQLPGNLTHCWCIASSRTCRYWCASRPRSVNTRGTLVANPQVTRWSSKGETLGKSPSATLLSEESKALSNEFSGIKRPPNPLAKNM